MRVKRRSRRPPVPASWRIGTKPVPSLTNQWRMSLWGNTPTWLFPTISRSLSKRAPSSTREQILRASQLQVKQLKWSFHKQTQFHVFCCLSPVGQMDFSQVSAPLMTPPISPAALVHRGSVINQGPLTGRPLTSSSTTCPSSSSSSCLPSLSPVAQNSPCASFPENLYHCLPQTSSGFFQTSSSSGSNYQPALRSA